MPSRRCSDLFLLLSQTLVTADLSNFYLDVAKDRLYIPAPAESRRRSCQTVLAIAVEAVAAALAPVVPHLAEDIWQAIPYERSHGSVFEAGWPKLSYAVADAEAWAAIRALRDEVNKCLEAARNEKALGASLEAKARPIADLLPNLPQTSST